MPEKIVFLPLLYCRFSSSLSQEIGDVNRLACDHNYPQTLVGRKKVFEETPRKMAAHKNIRQRHKVRWSKCGYSYVGHRQTLISQKCVDCRRFIQL